MTTLNEEQDKIVDEFSGLTEWFDKYDYIIRLGDGLEPMEAQDKNEENAISGCQSQLWVKTMISGEKLVFRADSDAKITKGIIALILRVVNDRRPQEIRDADFYFIEKIGLASNLSPARSNGVQSIMNRIVREAREASTNADVA